MTVGINPECVRMSLSELETRCFETMMVAGASEHDARSLSRATCWAEASGQPHVGLAHFFDYCSAIQAGRMVAATMPRIDRVAPAMVSVDGQSGLPHLAFDQSFDMAISSAKEAGIALLAIRNVYTSGSLGYYAQRFADAGMMALCAANGPPLVAANGSRIANLSTNPMALAVPLGTGASLLIDQATSAAAFVTLRAAAHDGNRIPGDWAFDEEGKETTDPDAALAGVLRTFGGMRGSNVALLVEIMAAGLTGATWSMDAAPFDRGNTCSNVGLSIIIIDPRAIDAAFPERLEQHLDRLSTQGVHIPGRAKAARRENAARNGISLPRALADRLSSTHHLSLVRRGRAKQSHS